MMRVCLDGQGEKPCRTGRTADMFHSDVKVRLVSASALVLHPCRGEPQARKVSPLSRAGIHIAHYREG